MSKKFLNTCMDCRTVSSNGVWIVKVGKGPLFATEKYLVGHELGPEPDHFDLDIIDADALAKKYNVTYEEAEDAIMSGEPACPHCGSVNFYYYNEEMDKDFLMK